MCGWSGEVKLRRKDRWARNDLRSLLLREWQESGVKGVGRMGKGGAGGSWLDLTGSGSVVETAMKLFCHQDSQGVSWHSAGTSSLKPG